MREFVRLFVLLAVGGGAYALWRLYSYPGGWAYALHPRHATDRSDLDRARRAAHGLARETKKELDAAHAGVTRAERLHRARIRGLEQEIHDLRHPGRGPEVAQLGSLTLHRHSVIKDDLELPLQGLAIDHKHAQQQDFIHLTPIDGDPCYASYSCAEHDSDEVRRFAMRLESAVADERSHHVRSAKLVTQKQDELAEVQADSSLEDEARAHLAEVIRRQRKDPRPQTTQRELSVAHDRWHELTGKRPR